jgi:hypothetical protein
MGSFPVSSYQVWKDRSEPTDSEATQVDVGSSLTPNNNWNFSKHGYQRQRMDYHMWQIKHRHPNILKLMGSKDRFHTRQRGGPLLRGVHQRRDE